MNLVHGEIVCFSKGVWLGESLFSWKLFLTSCKRNKAFFSRAVSGHLSGRWIAEPREDLCEAGRGISW